MSREEFHRKIGAEIQEARRKGYIKQKELAEASGVQQTYISKIEAGNCVTLPLYVYTQIKKALAKISRTSPPDRWQKPMPRKQEQDNLLAH
jgi:predicted transcriptional regulator